VCVDECNVTVCGWHTYTSSSCTLSWQLAWCIRHPTDVPCLIEAAVYTVLSDGTVSCLVCSINADNTYYWYKQWYDACQLIQLGHHSEQQVMWTYCQVTVLMYRVLHRLTSQYLGSLTHVSNLPGRRALWSDIRRCSPVYLCMDRLQATLVSTWLNTNWELQATQANSAWPSMCG